MTLTSKGDPKEFRIGFQKAAAALVLLRASLVLLRANGSLEKRLQPEGVRVTWSEFTAGPQLLEGLNAGSIDFRYVGEVPPIFALAAGANFVYTAYELSSPQAEGILVGKESPIQQVAQLKGKKIALNKGSDVHWLVVNAVEKAGLNTVTYNLCFSVRQTHLDGWYWNRESLSIFPDLTHLRGETTGDRGDCIRGIGKIGEWIRGNG